MNHKEAFMLMQYQCENVECRAIEIIWNSRDGVTPFMGPSCREFNDSRERQCGGTTTHVKWDKDIYSPDYEPSPGMRIWRDGTLDMMRDIKRRMVERNPEYLDEDIRGNKEETDAFIEQIAVADHEAQSGWPALVEAHTGEVDGL